MAHRDIVVLHNELISNQEITFDLPQEPYILVIAIHSDSVSNEW